MCPSIPLASCVIPTIHRLWFDLSLSSMYGSERTDMLKFQNRHTHQEMLFDSLGCRLGTLSVSGGAATYDHIAAKSMVRSRLMQ